MTAGVNSMQSAFEKIGEHDDLIHQDILPQLKEIRKEQEALAKEIGKIALSQSSLELTVMKDGQQTRELLGRFVDHYFGTDDKKLVMKEKVTLQTIKHKDQNNACLYWSIMWIRWNIGWGCGNYRTS